MPFCTMLAAVLLPGVIRLGNLRVSVFGFFAAAGLIAAVSLSQKTARLVGLSAQRIWDAGVWSIVAAFVLSRALLIAEDPAAFRRYPLVVLSLPSLTYEAMALTAAATAAYLRWKRLRLLTVLDAWTPPAALLAGVLALGHFVEGTDAGMPTSLPWGVVTPGDTILGRVHPVQLYMLAAAAVIGVFSYRALQRPRANGAVAGRAMLEGGVAFFVLDMFAQPYDAHSAMLLDPGQFVALGCAVAGCAMWVWRMPIPESLELPRSEVASLLDDWLHSRPGCKWTVDNLMNETFTDPLLVEVQERLIYAPQNFPPTKRGQYCNEEGIEELHAYVLRLRTEEAVDAK